MKGYFSELARHTGLRTATDRAPVEGTPAVNNKPAQSSVRSAAAGLEVEEVTFVSAPQRAADPPPVTAPAPIDDSSRDTAAVVSDRADTTPPEFSSSEPVESGVEPPFQPAVTIVESGVDATTPDLTADAQISPLETVTESSEPRVLISPPVHADAPTSAPELHELDSSESLHEISTFELNRPSDVDDEPSPAPPKVTTSRLSPALEDGESDPPYPIERQTIVRNYLKEVSEWLSTPAPDAEETASLAEAASAESTTPSMSRRPQASLTSESRDAPEQRDLSLSIGTIKIVIEEPQTSTAAVPAPPPPPDRARSEITKTPTDLSRYYLNRW
jgi:hypothetical protein